MGKKISPAAIQPLKEALCNIYWYKDDLRNFLENCISERSVVYRVNWRAYKREIVTEIIAILYNHQEKYMEDLQTLFLEVAKMEDFSHLERLDDGKRKAESARRAVNALKRIVSIHSIVVEDVNKAEERKRLETERNLKRADFQNRLQGLKDRYIFLVSSTNHHKRGFELEKVLYQLFELYDLDPKASFRNLGEQIDGAFSLEGTDYLFEAKWQQQPAAIQELDAFASKVRRKLDNTLGLFLSINGFSPEGVTAHSHVRPVAILMTGADLMAVLEERIDFTTLLLRKRRHASQTGSILIQAHEMAA